MGGSYSTPSRSYSSGPKPPKPTHRKRVADLQVIGVGLPRTGTSSLSIALLTLGCEEPYHFSNFLKDSASWPKWQKALQAKYEGKGIFFQQKDWDDLLATNGALTDIPCLLFAQELHKMYPFAKIILTIRDSPEEWADSYRATIQKHFKRTYLTNNGVKDWFKQLMAKNATFRDVCRMIDQHFLAEIEEDPEAFYTRWVENMRSVMPEDKLLIYNVKEGWEPLCRFLGIDRDRVERFQPFPHLNKRQTFPSMFMGSSRKGSRLSLSSIGSSSYGGSTLRGGSPSGDSRMSISTVETDRTITE